MPLLYKIPGPSLVQPALIPSPLSVGGCGIWLDSADTSAASMTFSSGQNISVWKDKSGNANNFSALQGVTTVITDGPYSVVKLDFSVRDGMLQRPDIPYQQMAGIILLEHTMAQM